MSAGLRAQGKIQGQVLNETLHRPVANLEVRLLSPKGGMQEVATAMTDRDGRFFFGPEKIDPSAFTSSRRASKTSTTTPRRHSIPRERPQ